MLGYVDACDADPEHMSDFTALHPLDNQIIKDLLGYYQTNNFITEKGFDIQPNTQRITEYFIQNFGLQKPFDGTKTVELCQNCIIYPYY